MFPEKFIVACERVPNFFLHLLPEAPLLGNRKSTRLYCDKNTGFRGYRATLGISNAVTSIQEISTILVLLQYNLKDHTKRAMELQYHEYTSVRKRSDYPRRCGSLGTQDTSKKNDGHVDNTLSSV